jgi:hypothetical protein
MPINNDAPIQFGSIPIEDQLPVSHDVRMPPRTGDQPEAATPHVSEENDANTQTLANLSQDYAHSDAHSASVPPQQSASVPAPPAHTTNPAIMNIPRRVTRNDNDFSARRNDRNVKKSYRDNDGNLIPAGSGMFKGQPVTRLDHEVVKKTPEGRAKKGNSPYTSFTNQKLAPKAQSYGGEQATLKARKLANAKFKGKADVADTSLKTTKGLLKEFGEMKRATPKSDKDKLNDLQAATSYVRKDGEFHTEGPIPSRFLSYSDRPQQGSGYDSDSVSEAETDYDDSDHFSNL